MDRTRAPSSPLRKRFSDFILATTYSDLSPAVVHAAKLCLLDLVGVALAGARQRVTAIAHATVGAAGGEPQATLWGFDRKVPVPMAAMLNAVSGHAIDMDDGHRFANGHPGVVTIPPAIALAEHADLTGRELIEAVVVGYEFFIRLGSALNPDLLQRGFHTTATVGSIAAGAAAARLLRLSGPQTEQALALAALQSAGLLETLTSGESGKSFQVGKAAQSGILAARMAQHGADGPELVFEGDKGFFKAFAGKTPDPDALCASLGRGFGIPTVYFKRHAACRHIHSALDALAEIAAANPLAPDDVLAIDVETYSIAHSLTGHVSAAGSELGAKFSTPIAAGLLLVFGRTDAAAFTRANVSDPRVRAIAGKTTVRVNPARDVRYPGERSAHITLRTRAAAFEREVAFPKGEPEFPLTDSEMQAKFEANAGSLYPRDHARRISDTIMSIESRRVRALTALLTAPAAETNG
jgi:2-methylcitrate dehydratase PrpD